MQGTLTSPFVTSNVKWLDAKTFHFTQMSVSGYKNHARNGGWNRGNYAQTDVAYTVEHDRDVSFLVDKADVDETNETASIQNISRVFEQTQVVPETDALFFSKVAKKAQETDGYHSSTATSAYTKAKVSRNGRFTTPKTTFPLLHTTALSRSFAPCTEIFALTAIQTSKVDFDSQAMSATSKGCRHGFLPSTFLSHCRLSTTSPSFRLHKRQNQYSVTNSPE